jgi:hypothetical protein
MIASTTRAEKYLNTVTTCREGALLASAGLALLGSDHSYTEPRGRYVRVLDAAGRLRRAADASWHDARCYHYKPVKSTWLNLSDWTGSVQQCNKQDHGCTFLILKCLLCLTFISILTIYFIKKIKL